MNDTNELSKRLDEQFRLVSGLYESVEAETRARRQLTEVVSNLGKFAAELRERLNGQLDLFEAIEASIESESLTRQQLAKVVTALGEMTTGLQEQLLRLHESQVKHSEWLSEISDGQLELMKRLAAVEAKISKAEAETQSHSKN